jgi:hypothetical protein
MTIPRRMLTSCNTFLPCGGILAHPRGGIASSPMQEATPVARQSRFHGACLESWGEVLPSHVGLLNNNNHDNTFNLIQ